MGRSHRDSPLETHHLLALPKTGQIGCPQLGPPQLPWLSSQRLGCGVGVCQLPDETGMSQAPLVFMSDFLGAPLSWLCRGQAPHPMNSPQILHLIIWAVLWQLVVLEGPACASQQAPRLGGFLQTEAFDLRM